MPIIFTDGRRGLFLISSDYRDASFLMHYRRGGEKRGVRRWQNKDGSYTPEGYLHYKEMYGWGDRKDRAKIESNLRNGVVRGINGRETSSDAKHRMFSHHGGIDPTDAASYSNRILSELHIPVEKLNDIKRLSAGEDIDKVLHDINHRDEEGGKEVAGTILSDTGRQYNCPNCACAFEMVQRDYDVVARRAPDGSNVGDIERNFKGGHLLTAGVDWEDDPIRLAPTPKKKRDRLRYFRDLEKWGQELSQTRDKAIKGLRRTLEEQGAGARGIIVVGWLSEYSLAPTTDFHALNYKIDDDGVMMLYDTQSWRKCTGTYDLGMLYGCDPRELHYMRTDNLDLDESITERVYSRGRSDK